jgi:hypothetical protein
MLTTPNRQCANFGRLAFMQLPSALELGLRFTVAGVTSPLIAISVSSVLDEYEFVFADLTTKLYTPLSLVAPVVFFNSLYYKPKYRSILWFFSITSIASLASWVQLSWIPEVAFEIHKCLISLAIETTPIFRSRRTLAILTRLLSNH